MGGIGPRRPGAVASAMLLGALASGCVSDATVPAEEAHVAASVGEATNERHASPLTGRSLPEAAVARPVLALKVDNHADARPQRGLSLADVVYEQRVDGDHTRFLAFFHSALPARVGPLRSTRLPDAALTAPYNAVYSAEAAAGDIQRVMEAVGVVPLLPEDLPAAFDVETRDGGRLRTYALPQRLLDAAVGRAPTVGDVGWVFSSAVDGVIELCTTAPGCVSGPGDDVTTTIAGSRVTWRYDDAIGGYLRIQDGVPHPVTDGRPIVADNVIVLSAPPRFEECCEQAGAPLSASGVVGSGPAALLRNGHRFDARWSKEDVGRPLRVVTGDGQSLPLRPGRTWIEIVPTSDAGPDAHDRIVGGG